MNGRCVVWCLKRSNRTFGTSKHRTVRVSGSMIRGGVVMRTEAIMETHTEEFVRAEEGDVAGCTDQGSRRRYGGVG